MPRTIVSMDMLARIERRYRLPTGYFKTKLPNAVRASTGHKKLDGISTSERRRLAWHLPDDFDRRPKGERDAILAWVRDVVISGSTDYRRFQASALKQRYAIRFPKLTGRRPATSVEIDLDMADHLADVELELAASVADAPPALAEEVENLVRFKTSILTEVGLQRNGIWSEDTALQKIEHLGLLFGALAASPRSTVRGAGVPIDSLAMGLLVFPAIWDWYILWRERRRGFFSTWEVNMLQLALALTRKGTGWLRQRPDLARRLRPIPGLVSDTDIEMAQDDWDTACDKFDRYGQVRFQEVRRVARIHRDPFEPILPILEAESPVSEYLRIANEIVRLMPDPNRYARPAAEAVRALLMIRLSLHLGVRQKNLRQLLVCPRGRIPTSDRQLDARRCGEMRWSERDKGWEVFIPASAFKNASSSFFARKPFRLVLPDLGDLYRHIDSYLKRHRNLLLKGLPDPGTFFVKTAKANTRDAAYDQTSFYDAWRLIIQRYGIHNPFTDRGAIKGLLPHGPHNVRDVLATHILKKTGSYEQASYAIQDTPAMVMKHYGRFFPEDKTALAAKILNEVWEAA